MSQCCRLSGCQWRGSAHEVFEHCEDFHPQCIKNHRDTNYYDFTLDDLTRDAYLLSGKEGLYWFSLDLQNDATPSAECLKRGVFHIGDSMPVDYTLKLGRIRDGHADYHGPFKSQAESPDKRSEEIYDVSFPFAYIGYLTERMAGCDMRLYLGEYDDSDDVYVPDADEVVWSGDDAVANAKCVELFTCGICMEYIRRQPRFCERRHFICLDCFNELARRKALICPFCRGIYTYDCRDERYDVLLKMVQFPVERTDAD